MDWFQGRILRGGRVVIENIDGCMRTKPVPDVAGPVGSRLTPSNCRSSMTNAEPLILEIVDGRRWSITVTDREGEFVAGGAPPRRG